MNAHKLLELLLIASVAVNLAFAIGIAARRGGATTTDAVLVGINTAASALGVYFAGASFLG